ERAHGCYQGWAALSDGRRAGPADVARLREHALVRRSVERALVGPAALGSKLMDIPIFFPPDGVNLNFQVGAQPPTTARAAKNAGYFDPLELRERGSQRHGLKRFLTAALGAGPVRDMNQIMTDAPRIIYAQNGYSDLHPVTTRWSTATDRGTYPKALQTDLDGRVYTFSNNGALSEFNRKGDLVRTFAVPGVTSTAGDVFSSIERIVVDEAGYIYVGVSKGAGGEETRIFQIRRVSEELGFFHVRWTLTTTAVLARDFAVRGGI